MLINQACHANTAAKQGPTDLPKGKDRKLEVPSRDKKLSETQITSAL